VRVALAHAFPLRKVRFQESLPSSQTSEVCASRIFSHLLALGHIMAALTGLAGADSDTLAYS
jgi:hypothetical protein